MQKLYKNGVKMENSIKIIGAKENNLKNNYVRPSENIFLVKQCMYLEVNIFWK